MWLKKFKKKKRMIEKAKTNFRNSLNNENSKIKISRLPKEVSIDDLVLTENEGDENNVKENISEEQTESNGST